VSEPYWAALGGGSVDYKGAWAAGTAYAAGDVVRYNGVDYLAVNPSTGVDPGVAVGPVDSGKELAYGERTTDLSLPTSGVDVITLAPITLDGATAIYAEAHATCTAGGGAGFGIDLYDGAVNLGKMLAGYDLGGYVTVSSRIRLVPTAGAHTYKLRGYGLVNTQTLYAGGGSNNVPALLRMMRA